MRRARPFPDGQHGGKTKGAGKRLFYCRYQKLKERSLARCNPSRVDVAQFPCKQDANEQHNGKPNPKSKRASHFLGFGFGFGIGVAALTAFEHEKHGEA